MNKKVYEKYTKTFLTNIFKYLDFYLDRNNPKSFVLSVTPRNRIENIIFFDLNFHQNKSIRKSIRKLVILI